VRIATDAVRLAAATGAPTIESDALNTLGLLRAYLGDVEGGLGMLRRALEIATESGSVDDMGRAYSNLQDVLIVAAARFDEAVEIGLQAVSASSAAPVSGIWTSLVWIDVAWAQYLGGHWDDALASLTRARLQAAGGVAEIEWEIRTAQILIGRGQFDEAAGHLDRLDRQLEDSADTQWIAPAAAARAEHAIWAGDPAAALRSIADGLARTQPSFGANVSRIGPLLALGTRAAADVAEQGHAGRSGTSADSARGQAEEHLATMQGIRDDIQIRWPMLQRLAEPFLALCSAEITRLDGRSDPAVWGTAADHLESMTLPYTAAYARFREGEASLSGRAGSRDVIRARAALGNALATARALGAAPLCGAVETVAERGGLDLDKDAARRRSAGPAGLTPREQEVLGLLAGGLTNREISVRLFITEKTASHHVSSVLAKLDVPSRAQAVVEAVRLGLTKPPD
jgi:DNA-binding CsgD family transcriptional regulator